VAKNPKFDAFVKTAVELHERKNHDYAEDSNPYSNFEFAARFADVPVNTVFDVMIGIKQARLLVLRGGKDPLNEGIADSEKDLAIYAMLKASYNLPEGPKTEPPDDPDWLKKSPPGCLNYEWNTETVSAPTTTPEGWADAPPTTTVGYFRLVRFWCYSCNKMNTGSYAEHLEPKTCKSCGSTDITLTNGDERFDAIP